MDLGGAVRLLRGAMRDVEPLEIMRDFFEGQEENAIVFAVISRLRASPRIAQLDEFLAVFFVDTHQAICMRSIDPRASIVTSTFG
jgi:hypothetical protein